jgi:hypothetical protein
MPNYRESVQQANVTKWTRAKRLVFDNTLAAVPALRIEEEEITQLPDITHHRDAGVIVTDLSEPATTIDLINPITGETIGTATHGDVYVMLYSLYLALAAKRDLEAQQ